MPHYELHKSFTTFAPIVLRKTDVKRYNAEGLMVRERKEWVVKDCAVVRFHLDALRGSRYRKSSRPSAIGLGVGGFVQYCDDSYIISSFTKVSESFCLCIFLCNPNNFLGDLCASSRL